MATQDDVFTALEDYFSFYYEKDHTGSPGRNLLHALREHNRTTGGLAKFPPEIPHDAHAVVWAQRNPSIVAIRVNGSFNWRATGTNELFNSREELVRKYGDDWVVLA
jgi:hypothetical protein